MLTWLDQVGFWRHIMSTISYASFLTCEGSIDIWTIIWTNRLSNIKWIVLKNRFYMLTL